LLRAELAAARALPVARTYQNNLPQALRGCAELHALRGRPGEARKLLDESIREAVRLEARAEEAASRSLRATGRTCGPRTTIMGIPA